MAALDGKTIGMMVASGFEQIEMIVARQAFEEEGAKVVVLSTKKEEVRGWRNVEWGESFPVDVSVLDAKPRDFDAIMIPGGLIAADTLRSDTHVVRLIREAHDLGISVAALGHAPWVLAEAGVLKGRKVTSINGIRTDLINAGGSWMDEAVVIDHGVVTGRNHHDLPDFCAGILDSIMAPKS
jgi:protease I